MNGRGPMQQIRSQDPGFHCLKCSRFVNSEVDRNRNLDFDPNKDWVGDNLDVVLECRGCGQQYNPTTQMPLRLTDLEYIKLRMDRIERMITQLSSRTYSGTVNLK